MVISRNKLCASNSTAPPRINRETAISAGKYGQARAEAKASTAINAASIHSARVTERRGYL